MDRDREIIQQKLRKIQQDIIQIKSSQLATGDSWVLYSITGSFVRTGSQKIRLDFTPESGGPFLWNIYSLNSTQFTVGSFFHDYTKQGRAYYTENQTGTINYIIQSTKKGTVQVTYV